MAERLLAGPSAKLRAKIAQKQEFRPTRTVEKNMPVGSKSLEKVPMLTQGLSRRVVGSRGGCRSGTCERHRRV